MPEVYELMVDCVGGPYDGTTMGKVRVPPNMDPLPISQDYTVAPWEQQVALQVYWQTQGCRVGSRFQLLMTFEALPPGGYPKQCRQPAYFYEITGREIDDENRQILCTARYTGERIVYLMYRPPEQEPTPDADQ